MNTVHERWCVTLAAVVWGHTRKHTHQNPTTYDTFTLYSQTQSEKQGLGNLSSEDKDAAGEAAKPAINMEIRSIIHHHLKRKASERSLM